MSDWRRSYHARNSQERIHKIGKSAEVIWEKVKEEDQEQWLLMALSSSGLVDELSTQPLSGFLMIILSKIGLTSHLLPSLFLNGIS